MLHVNRNLNVYTLAALPALMLIVWLGHETWMTVSAANRRRAIHEYYMGLNDTLLRLRDVRPLPSQGEAQLAIEKEMRMRTNMLHQKYGLLSDVRIISWDASHGLFEVRWAGKDGRLGTQDDETKQWDLDRSHPGMSAKQMDALR
jgi:hypothetical protein